MNSLLSDSVKGGVAEARGGLKDNNISVIFENKKNLI
jgi:hypothetical protein